MRRIAVSILLVCVCSVILVGPAVAAAQATRKDKDGKSDKAKRIYKYRKPTRAEIEANEKLTLDYVNSAKELLKIDFKLIKSEHFVVFSTLPDNRNEKLGEMAEKMYKALSEQFGLSPKSNIWVGKCPIFALAKKEDYQAFSAKVLKSGLGGRSPAYFHSTMKGYCYIVIGPCESEDLFYEFLVHEATHGFVARYYTSQSLPDWANEGLADYMAAELIEKSNARLKLELAEKEVLSGKADGAKVFKKFSTDGFDYGVTQSLVRFLIKTDKKKFNAYVKLIKEGQDDEKALKATYKWTHEELYAAWLKAITEQQKKRDEKQDEKK